MGSAAGREPGGVTAPGGLSWLQHPSHRPKGQAKRWPPLPGRIGINHSLSVVPVPENQQTSEHQSVGCEILAKPFASRELSVVRSLMFRRKGSGRFGFLRSSLWAGQQAVSWGLPPEGPADSPAQEDGDQVWRLPAAAGACPPHPSGSCQPCAPLSHVHCSCSCVYFFFFPTAAACWAEASAELWTETPGPRRRLMQ